MSENRIHYTNTKAYINFLYYKKKNTQHKNTFNNNKLRLLYTSTKPLPRYVSLWSSALLTTIKNSWTYTQSLSKKATQLKQFRTYAPIKKSLPKHWNRRLRFRFNIRSRFMLRQIPLITKNRKLLKLELHQYLIYRRLFSYGHFLRGANDFVMHREIKNETYASKALHIKYDQILADILTFRTWNLRRFCIRPVYMKRLLGHYFAINSKKAKNWLTVAARKKKLKTATFFRLFQYSLFSILYQAFRLMGISVLIHYIKSGFFLINGVVELNPLRPCKASDFIQFNIYIFFAKPLRPQNQVMTEHQAAKYHKAVLALNRPAHMVQRTEIFAFFMSFFRNFMLRTPWQKKRYYKTTYNQLLVWNSRLQAISMEAFFNISTQFPTREVGVNKNKGLNVIEKGWTNIYVVAQPFLRKSALKYNVLFKKYLLVRSFSIILDYQRNWDNKNVVTKKTEEAVALSHLVKKPKPRSLSKHQQKKKRYGTKTKVSMVKNKDNFAPQMFSKNDERCDAFQIWEHYSLARVFRLKYFVIKTSVNPITPTKQVRQAKKVLAAPKAALVVSSIKKNTRAKALSVSSSQTLAQKNPSWWQWQDKLTKATLLVDEDLFACSVLSTVGQNQGRRSFLNKSCIRFLVSFCA